MRINFTHPYVNVTQGSYDKGTGNRTSQPDYKPGTEFRFDSGFYRYLQATSATSTGHACKVILNGFATSNYNATRVTTADSGVFPTDIGVCVTDDGLAANQWGWFWLGEGEEYCRLAGTQSSYSGTLSTYSVAGELGTNVSAGDSIGDLICIDSNTSSGLRLCRSTRRLSTNSYYSTN